MQRTEEQLLRGGIEQTSQIIKDSLSTRANITATAIQQSDEKLAQNLQNSSQQIEKQLDQYQALLQSKLSRLKQMNEQIQTEEQQVQNKSLLKQLTTLNMALILGAAILIILVIALGFMGKSKYNEIRTLNMAINEKQMRVDHLNRSGGSLTFSTCRQQNSKAQRLCIQINKNAGEWQNGLHDSDGVLNDDRIRNTVIENHRRTTAAITATTSAIAAATENFRQFFESNSENIRSTGGNNQSRSRQLEANAEVIGNNAEAISRIREKYGNVYRADQWQSQRDEPNYNELRGRIRENLNRTAFSLVTSSQSAAEFTRNVRTIEATIVQMKELKKEMDQPQPKRDRGMNFGM